MARMVWTFSDVYTKVSEFLGLGSSPTGTDLTKVKDLVYRAYLKFLMPVNLGNNTVHIWSFCQKDAVLLTKSGQKEVVLPVDFETLIGPIRYGPNDNYSIQEVSLATLRQHQSYSDSTAYPYEYALKQSQYSPKTGQRRLMEFYPTPNAEHELKYTYSFTPEKPESDGDFFVGGPLASECILQMSLAEAETQEDETHGTHYKESIDTFNRLLKQDMPKAPRSLPIMVDGGMIQYDPFTYRANQLNRGPMTVYGVDFT